MNDTQAPENETAQPAQIDEATKAKIKQLRNITLIGYVGLLLLMPIWLIWINPPANVSINISLILFWLPLFFPMRGLIKGTPYTYAWANFVVMLNFMHGFTTLWVVPEDLVYAVLELIFATMMFLGGTYYARHKGRELGLKLPKLKDQK